MLSVAPNIVFAPNMMQNAERKHRTQNTNTAPIRPLRLWFIHTDWIDTKNCRERITMDVNGLGFKL